MNKITAAMIAIALQACTHQTNDSERVQRVVAENCERLEVIYETERRRKYTEPDRAVIETGALPNITQWK